MTSLAPEYLKVLFIFLLKTFEFRVEFIDSMPSMEFYNFFKILDCNNPIYYTYNNQNIQVGYTEEFFEVMKKKEKKEKIFKN